MTCKQYRLVANIAAVRRCSGFIKLKSSFDKIQNFGKKMDETGVHTILENDAFRGAETTLGTLKLDLETVETWYKQGLAMTKQPIWYLRDKRLSIIPLQ